jgi:3-oxoadipate enol-lactonase
MLHFHAAGNGPAVLFLHGFPLSHAIWHDQITHLAAKYRVIAPDLPGHGASAPLPDAEAATMEQMAESVLALLDHLKIERAAVVGHSMGGYVSFALQRMAPKRVSGLALVSSQARNDTPEIQAGRLSLAEKVSHEGAGALADLMASRLFADENDDSKLHREVTAMMRENPVEGIVGSLHAMAKRDDFRSRLPELKDPALVLTGEQDHLIHMEKSEQMAAQMPNATLVKLLDTGHMPMLEAPAKVNQALTRWLELVY